MPTDRELERNLKAFGLTLQHSAGERLAPDEPETLPSDSGVTGLRRRLLLTLAAAASVVGLLVGVVWLLDDDAGTITTVDAPVTPPNTPVTTATATATVPNSTDDVRAFVPSPIVPAPATSIEGVPRLVSMDSALPAPQRVTLEPPDDGDTDYLQVFTTSDGTGWLHIETSNATAVDGWIDGALIGPWSTHTSQFNGPGEATLWIVSGTVQVALASNILDETELRSLAGRVRQGATPGDGWSIGIPPAGLQPVVEGRASLSPVRLVNYNAGDGLLASIETNMNSPTLLSTQGLDPDGFNIVDLDGKRALLASDGLAPTLVWEFQPQIVVRLAVVDADLDALLRIARSIQDVPVAEWEQINTEPADDGCPSLFC